MGKIQWYINRLKAMNVKEVLWRLDQKKIQRQERKRFGMALINVGAEVWNDSLRGLSFDYRSLGINFENKIYNTATDIHQLRGVDYNKWPDTFSYALDYKQRDDLGDARTNWEKNRHFQWTLMAKAYFVSGDDKYLCELKNEVHEWCEQNPFLHGISWTSAMEFAIRAINWMYTLAFLQARGNDIQELRNGILNIVEYLTVHYSRYSSANNHLLVEATAIGLAGYAFNYLPWKKLAINILTEELEKQNYSDGVNKELSLHYQTFGMEAYLLLARVSGEKRWSNMLEKEAEFVALSSWHEKIVCEFGDDDEGKILDLQGGEWNQWEWTLQLASLVIGIRYSSFDNICENTRWLFTDEEIAKIKKLPLYDSAKSRCFKEGGNSFLRDKDDRVLIGIDHAALGFCSIAAHGHADALSLQMYVDGQCVFADPGTYIYHCNLPARNAFRKTINHNTLCLINKNSDEECFVDQSQMLGAFLWGKRAGCTLELYTDNGKENVLIASHNGYKPLIHRRTIEFDKVQKTVSVKDEISENHTYVITYMLGADVSAKMQDDNLEIALKTGKIDMTIDGHDRICIEDAELSLEYGVKVPTKAIRIYGHQKQIISKIAIKF